MEIFENKSLRNFNTFGIDVNAEKFHLIRNEKDIFELLEKEKKDDFTILGGGSNILLTKDIKNTVLKNEIKGIDILLENENEVLIKIGGGEIWHDLVLWAVSRNYGGIENLSLIPGTVGAAPIQNIGAYGVELKDVFTGVDFIHLEKKEKISFDKSQCKFGYRNSIFKKELKGKFFITHVYLQLTKSPHQLNLSYGAISSELEKQGIRLPTLKEVSNTVIRIRESKLPNPKTLGNSGSFFKNPEITKEEFERLKNSFPNIPSYPLPDNKIKIPAAWLLEQCGFKGVRYGNTGCYEKQPLVLVNYGKATGQEIYSFALRLQKAVDQKFGISIHPEVNIW